MTRARHRWLGFGLFCAVYLVLCCELPTTSAVKATALFFSAKTSTTAAPEETANDGEQLEATAEGSEVNKTNSKYTGIPQIDYIHDPNLPRELNGYNLSEYPFYEAVPPPETMDFKCDGLHDGFYASVEHKCQVYHHCLFGTRYDFLCANYTAFDQKTFICHFVSEVDCKNSPNYFSRNEALYKAASTTTVAPPPPPPTTSTTPPPPLRPARPAGRRRPVYYDYYDDDYYYNPREYDEYEDRDYPRRRPRPRPQSRPVKKNRPPVDDYEEDRPIRRPPSTARDENDEYDNPRPYARPTAKRPYDRRPYDEGRSRSGSRRRPRPRDDDDEEYRPNKSSDDRVNDDDEPVRARGEIRPRDERPKDDIRPRDERPRDGIRPRDEVRQRNSDSRPYRDEIQSREPEARPLIRDPDKDARPVTEDLKPLKDEGRPIKEDLRPLRDEFKPKVRDEYRPRDETRPEPRKPYNFRPRDERRPDRDDNRSNRGNRYQNQGRRYNDELPKPRDDKPRPFRERNYEDEEVDKKIVEAPTAPGTTGLVKPKGTGIFSQPRMPPKIKRPVPKNEKEKYDYKPVVTTKEPPKMEDEYYDYEEDENSQPSSSGKSSAIQQRPLPEPVEKERFKPTRPHFTPIRPAKRPLDYDDIPAKVKIKPKLSEDYYYDYDDKRDIDGNDRKRQKDEIDTRVREVRPTVRVVKRPFLPSRGGSPYLPRGLQPVNGRDVRVPFNTTPKPTTTSTTTTTPEPITNPPTTTTSTTTTKPPTTTSTTTTTTTTTDPPTTTTTYQTTTTTKPTTTITTQSSVEVKPEEEYEYYDEEDIEYDKKELSTVQVETTTKTETTTNSQPTTTQYQPTTTRYQPTTIRYRTTTTTQEPETSTAELTTPDQQAQYLASKVLQVYNENYEAMREKLESTLSPGDYIKPYLATSKPTYRPNNIEQPYKQKPKPKPEISKPYSATGKPFIPDIAIKQNLANSVENDYDIINEALTPNVPLSRIPSGFISADRDYTFSRFRNNFNAEPQFAASELNNYQVRKRQPIQVSIRTPNSYYLQPQRVVFQDEVPRYPRQLGQIGHLYRQLGNMF